MPMQKTLPLPYLRPSDAVLARIRHIARQVKPQPLPLMGEWSTNIALS